LREDLQQKKAINSNSAKLGSWGQPWDIREILKIDIVFGFISRQGGCGEINDFIIQVKS